MSVTKTLRALGNWSVSLSDRMPSEIWDQLQYFGHIAIHAGRVDPRVAGDSMLRSARYVGVLRGRSESGLPKKISGLDVAMWLGDPDNKGDIIEELLNVSGDLDSVVADVMAGFAPVTIGTLTNVGGTFTQGFQFQSRRQIIDYIAQTFPGTNAWRVNGDATLDVGPESVIFRTVPEVAVVRKQAAPSVGGSEVDLFMRSLFGSLETNQDVEDLTTRVLLMAQGTNGQFASAAVDAPPGTHPYLDLHGNPIKMTRVVQESETSDGNAEARAQLQLNRFLGTRDALTLSTEYYDIQGEAQVGDYLWVWDPTMGLEDVDNEVIFRGQRMNPFKLQMTETTWPISRGMSVAYRHWDGFWIDITDYVIWETGDTTIVVGGYNRALSESSGGVFPVTPPPDTSVPDVVVWAEPFLVGVYQSPTTGQARGDVLLTWTEPENVGGGIITDGSHYDIRYRRATIPAYPITWDMLEDAGLTWDDLEASGATWDHPITYPETDWQSATAPFDVTTFRLQELVPAMPYEVQIRAVDLANPSNRGAWSDLALFQTTKDDIAPATPAPPFIASNPLYVQMTHTLGVSTGGTFNLDRDLHHLELHGGPEPLFSCTDDTLIGKALANYGSIVGQIPVVQSFSIASLDPVYFKVIAVDEAGNKSSPSVGVGIVVGLIDDQWMTSLTASKITAGTIDASVLVGGRIATMPESGFPGVEMTSQGLEGWNTVGFRSLFWDSSTGRLHVNGNGGIEIKDGTLQVKNSAGQVIVEIGECSDTRHGVQVFSDTGTRIARMGEIEAGGGDHGIEVISDLGDLVKIDTLAFGMESGYDAAQVTTTLNTFNGNTPACTVVVGNSGRCIVYINAFVAAIGTGFGSAGFSGDGPGGASVAANVNRVVGVNGGNSIGAGRSFHMTGLAPGTWTFSMTYRSTTAGQLMSFSERQIVAQPY